MAAHITTPCAHLCHDDRYAPCNHEHGWQDCPGCHEARERIKAIVAEAVQFAQESPEPDPSELYTDVYVEA